MDFVRINRSKIHQVILPIFKTTKKEPHDLISFQGTGFIIAPKILVTCWHCIEEPLQENEQYSAIVVKEDGTDHKLITLYNIDKDSNGNDLATASHDYEPSEYLLKVPLNDAAFGAEIWTYGYPFTAPELLPNRSIRFMVPPQFFKGYIVRNLIFKQPGYGDVKSYELDLNVPKGLSGAPVMGLGDTIVFGVIYGSNDIATIDHLSLLDPETGYKQPEIQRIVSLGVAHYTENLLLVRGKATDSVSLLDYCNRFVTKNDTKTGPN
ncbi:MAG: trypsin-like peptidase domain-containing protein [Thermodesulfobacteriota bacterium]